MEKKKRKRSPVLLILLILVLLVAVGAAVYAGYVRQQYVILDGVWISRDSESLDLRNRGLRHVADLRRCQQLRSLDLRGNDIEPEDLRALQEALPECFIRYDVDLGGERYDVLTEVLAFRDIPEDWENLLSLPRLRSLRIEQCTDPETMEKLRAALPQCDMHWNLGVGGEWYDSRITALTAPAAAYYEELLSQLHWFTRLESADLAGVALSDVQIRSLRDAYPDVGFVWTVRAGTLSLRSDTQELYFSNGSAEDLSALEGVLDLLPALKKVDFSGSGVPTADRLAFLEAHGELDVGWNVILEGVVYPWDTEMLDFNNYHFDNTFALEEAMEQLPRLKTVELCDCGLGNETLYELNRKFEDVQVIWKVYFGERNAYALRTDALYFRPSEFGPDPPAIRDADTAILRYCTEMRGLDLGHQYFTDLSFLEYMPHMTYLIIAECPITDISPLSQLKELKYLEFFNTSVSDFSPLVECTALKALNVCYTKAKQADAFNALKQMPWLEYLWYCSCPLTTAQLNTLKAQAPNLVTFTLRGGESSGGQWRYNKYYYEMRDFFGNSWYMPSGTNGVDPDNPSTQIIIDDAGNTFYLEDYRGEQYWWREERYSWMNPYIIGVTTAG